VGLIFVLGLAPLSSTAADAPRARFGNLSFETTQWTVKDQGSTMTLYTQNSLILGKARVTIGPEAQIASADYLKRAVQTLSAGKTVTMSVPQHFEAAFALPFPIDQQLLKFSDGTSALIYLIDEGNKVVPFVFTGDTEQASNFGRNMFLIILLHMRREDDSRSPISDQPPILAGIGTPSALGADPYDSINWNGPKELGYSPYDIHPVTPTRDLAEIVATNSHIIGSVPAKPMSFNAVIAELRQLINNPQVAPRYAQMKNKGAKDELGLMRTALVYVVADDPQLALLQLYSAYEFAPNDGNNLFNLAAILALSKLANESLAVLTEMEARGKKPDPVMVNSDAMMEYLKGYDQLLIDQTATAKRHLHTAVDLDPFLYEAARALALAQKLTGESEQGEETYKRAVWRRRPAEPVVCGGADSGDGSEPKPLRIRPPITDMLDLSKGKPGVLPVFKHPSSGLEAIGIADRYRASMNDGLSKTYALVTQSGEFYKQRLAGRPKNSTDQWYQYLNELMNDTLQYEPPIKKLMEENEVAQKELMEASKRIAEKTAVTVMTSMLRASREEKLQLVSSNVSALKPYALAYDTAARRLFKVRHKYLTGIAAHFGNKDWFQYETERLQADTGLAWGGVMTTLVGAYGGVAYTAVVPPERVGGASEGPETETEAFCPDGLRDLGLEIEFEIPFPPVHLSMKEKCDSVTAGITFFPEAEGFKGLAEFDAGVFVEGEYHRKEGNLSVFTGLAGKAGMGFESVTGKAGVVIEANLKTGDINSIGVKATLEGTQQSGFHTQTVAGLGEIASSRFVIVPAVEVPAHGISLYQPPK
jgi:hypothetical protein